MLTEPEPPLPRHHATTLTDRVMDRARRPDQAANAIFEYLEIFHNRQRRHSALNMHTPVEYETMHQTRQPAA